jgi:hypothetical protein
MNNDKWVVSLCPIMYVYCDYECPRGMITFVYLTLFCCKVCSM